MTIDQAREFVYKNTCVTAFIGHNCCIAIGDERHEVAVSIHSDRIAELYDVQEAIARLIVRATEEIK